MAPLFFKNKIIFSIFLIFSVSSFENELEVKKLVLTIDNFSNVIDYYLSIIEPEKYINCEVCGIPIKKTGKNQKMCKECWEEHRKNYQKELMRERRNNKLD